MPETLANICNPKRQSGSSDASYDYYAGYSSAFVESALAHFAMPKGATVLDPWNGSGTTTRTAANQGFNSIGFDLNPAMIVVARADEAHWATIEESVVSLRDTILEGGCMSSDRTRHYLSGADLKVDPLCLWFDLTTARNVRKIERCIYSVLVASSSSRPQVNDISPLAAFFYLAAFELVRKLIEPFYGSNPTWIKVAGSEENRIHVSRRVIKRTFDDCLVSLCQKFRQKAVTPLYIEVARQARPHASDRIHTSKLSVADSTRLPLLDHSIDGVITSPPYCTRLDYVVATRPELAILGYSSLHMDELRRRMLGTNTVPKARPQYQPLWGTTCLRTLTEIESHSSRASRGYYDKWAAQYFMNLQLSLCEISRVLRPGGRCAVVVQDSFYKDIHIDLPTITVEMLTLSGLNENGRAPYEVNHTFAGINPRVRPYRKTSNAVESVLLFCKPL